jgi:3-isopropylmalate/(R)-2-methylmalate dehydratase small subunit
MKPFTTLTSAALALPEDRIDTDILFPARFLLLMAREGLGRYFCHDRRFDARGVPLANPFDAAPSQTGILITGKDFGCGSSREQAVWSLADFGFRCVFAESFGEIFAANCVNSGVLAVALPGETLRHLAELAEDGPLTVDLGRQTVGRGNDLVDFTIAAATRERLLNGWDEIDTIAARSGGAIGTFEEGQRARQPWLFSGTES